MPLHPPSAPTSPEAWRQRPVGGPAPAANQTGQHPPNIGQWFSRFWKRVTEGLELSELWKQFKTDARASYRFYRRDFDARAGQDTHRRPLDTAQEFVWAILEKLSPARRVMLLAAILLLIFGGANFSYTNDAGQRHGLVFDFHLWGGLLLLLLLMLEVADRVIMKRDLEIARDIQKWLLPANPPQVPGLAMAFATRPANTVAGDFYDIFPRPGSEGRWLIAVADVAGKSIPAALLMATFQASLKTLSATPCKLEELAAGMNRYACTNSQEGLRFTTAFLAEYDAAARNLTYINAGHNVPVLRRITGALERLEAGGLPLGIQEAVRYEAGTVILQSGDWLLIFTDGLVEAQDKAGQEYGEERLLDLLQSNSGVQPQDLLNRIMTSLDGFVGETPQHDDVTCMLIKVA